MSEYLNNRDVLDLANAVRTPKSQWDDPVCNPFYGRQVFMTGEFTRPANDVRTIIIIMGGDTVLALDDANLVLVGNKAGTKLSLPEHDVVVCREWYFWDLLWRLASPALVERSLI